MRHIDSRFIEDLLHGDLQYFLDMVKSNREVLSLEIRNGYINIYYRGGNLLKITQKKTGYSFHFDAKYCKHKDSDTNFELLNTVRSDDIDSYKKYFLLMMQEMDSWFEKHPKPERDYQHQLLVNNLEIVDIEYQVGKCMRLDMLYFANNKLFVVENKYGTGAIGGEAGLSKHYDDICKVLNDTALLDEMIDSVCYISKAKKALGLRDSAIERTDIKSIEILFLLANYNRKSHSYSNELERMDGSVSAYILMTTSEQFKINLKEAEFIFADEN
jgi:hypothetical protein